MTKFNNTYRIESTRMQHWDYGWNGRYFITICTVGRKCFFGEIQHGEMHLSKTGQLAHQFWTEIPVHFPFVLLDVFVVMPNHIHGIVIIDKRNGDGIGDKNGDGDGNGNGNGNGYGVETRHCLVSTDNIETDADTDVDFGIASQTHPNTDTDTQSKSTPNQNKSYQSIQQTQQTPGQKRFQNPGKNTISSIIGSYKSVVTRHARTIIPDFGWQSRFYNHIIRNDKSFKEIKGCSFSVERKVEE